MRHLMIVRDGITSLVLLGALLLGQATAASAQDLEPPDVSQAATSVIQPSVAGTAAMQSGLSRQSIAGRTCCNRKGATIGAAIGAGLGALFSLACDAGDCTSTYVRNMAVSAGIGGGLGAWLNERSASPWPSRLRISVLAVSRSLRAAARVTF